MKLVHFGGSDAKPLLGLRQLQESWNGKVAVYGCVLVVVLFLFFFLLLFLFKVYLCPIREEAEFCVTLVY